MTPPKEKAVELVTKYIYIDKIDFYQAKQCALIAVDVYLLWSNNDNLDYLEEVKKEINKL